MLFKRKRNFSSFVTEDFKKRQNRNEAPLKNRTKFAGIFGFFGDKIINTSSIERSNKNNARAKDAISIYAMTL